MAGMSAKLQPVFDAIKARNPNEPEFLQAAEEILHSLGPVVEADGGDKYIAGTVGLGVVFLVFLSTGRVLFCYSAHMVGVRLVWVSAVCLAPASATIAVG